MGFWHRLRSLVARLLRALWHALHPSHPGDSVADLKIVFQLDEEVGVGEIAVAPNSGPLTGTILPVDADGNATTLDGVPVWASSDESVATAEAASEDGLTGTVTIVGGGVALITATSQETNNETGDPYELTAHGTVTVQSPDAVSASIEFSQ